jgi:hypothetical protein
MFIFSAFFYTVPPPQLKSLDTLMDQVEPEERLFFAALDKELAKIEAFCESNNYNIKS